MKSVYSTFSDIDRLDCQIEGLADMLEVLYIYAVNDSAAKGEEENALTGMIYALQEYTERMNEFMQRIQKSVMEAKINDQI